jgi:hypothetical protein
VTFDQIDRMVREANPVPESALVDVDLDLLPDSEWRDDMRTDQTLDRGPVIGERPPKPSPPRWLGVAAALVAVVAVMAVLTQTGLVEDEPPVADSEAALLEIAQTMAQAMAEGDSATLLGLLSDNADVDIATVNRIEDIPVIGEFWAASKMQLTPGECRLRPAPASGESRVARCEFTMTNAWAEALDVAAVDTDADFRIQGGEVTTALLRMPGRFMAQTFDRFTAWRDETHPEAIEIMHEGRGTASLSPEALELWREYTEEFVAEHSADETGLLETAESMAQAIAAGDSASLLDLLSDDGGIYVGRMRGRTADVPAFGAMWMATGWQLSPGECRLFPPPASGSARLVQCEMEGLTNSWSRALGVDPLNTVVDIRTVDGRVTYADLRIPGRFHDASVRPFLAWRDQRYPEAAEIMEDVSEYVIFTDESIELWRQYTEEFVAEHSAG